MTGRLSWGVCLSIALLIPQHLGAQAESGRGGSNSPPRLVVLIVVDQMRADHVERYSDQWTGGLRRLIDDGAWFTHAEYQYSNTATCPGHATIATGTNPAKHGVIGNAWYDRDRGRGRRCNSADLLQVPTLADALQEQGKDPLVLSFSQKPRSARMLGGRRPDVLASLGSRSWNVTSETGGPWLDTIEGFIKVQPIESDRDVIWTPLASRSDSAGAQLGQADLFSYPLRLDADGGFNRRFYQRWYESPFSDDYLGAMAMAAVSDTGVGRADRTDFMGIGFSALDRVGHDFGPDSPEVRDVLFRLDLTLGRFFRSLDDAVGRDHYVVALSSDHGVAPNPERLAARGIDAGRLDTDELMQRVAAVTRKLYGRGDHVAAVAASGIYFAPRVFESLVADAASLEEVEEAIRSFPGVAAVYRGDRLGSGNEQSMTPSERQAARGYFVGRSGDLIIAQRRFWTLGTNVANHSTGHDYDVRVPLMLMGQGIKRGRYDSVVSPTDIAPTLAHLVGITLEQADGQVLSQAFQ